MEIRNEIPGFSKTEEIENSQKDSSGSESISSEEPHSPIEKVETGRNLKKPLTKRKRCGVIGFYHDKEKNDFSFLLVERGHSIGYAKILMGHYDINDLGILVRLLEDTTTKERERILTQDFHTLYVDFWGKWDPRHKASFFKARTKFDCLRKGISQGTYHYSWARLIKGAKQHYDNPVKEFPKGRKNNQNESDFDCALREFSEETGFSPLSYVLIPYTKPFLMEVIGMDGHMYENLFYVVRFYNKENVDDRESSEVKKVVWSTYQEAMDEIRPHEKPQKDLLSRAPSPLDTNVFSREIKKNPLNVVFGTPKAFLEAGFARPAKAERSSAKNLN